MSVRVKRQTGKHWRNRAFQHLSERDGLTCTQCGAAHKTIWRQMGCWSGERWGSDPWECFRYTKINPTSNLEVEHSLPLSEGGTNDLSNLRLMCCDCHKAKTSAERSTRLKRLFAVARA